jgi:hypothetical protein
MRSLEVLINLSTANSTEFIAGEDDYTITNEETGHLEAKNLQVDT